MFEEVLALLSKTVIMTLKKYLTILRLVYISLMSTLALFTMVSFFVFFSGEGATIIPTGLPKYAILAVALATLAGWTFTGKLLKTDPNIPLQQRLQSWYNYKVIRGGVLETVGLIGVVGAIVTYDAMYFLAPVFIFAILFTVLPSERRIQIDLALSEEEMEELKKLNQ
ncbi:hypothetical protein [uncultured Imperialibacter sp.]|uniref:hypothetical protein n=1 Tax=uncultured Imperialibacter sp. TaxID=1672639 RepID=UPI0030D980D3|tara:strand:- start:116 stop:619 length:504 start_codon:yes stop_codon:yes gene_type:complete